MGHSPWGRKESDTAERLHYHYAICVYILGNKTNIFPVFFRVIVKSESWAKPMEQSQDCLTAEVALVESVIEPGPGVEKLGRACGALVWGGPSPSVG